MIDYEKYDAIALAELIKTKQISADELLDAVISKVEIVNPQLNFLSQKLYDYAKNAIMKGLPEGPFTGVPFVLKDLGVMLKGTITTHGSTLYKNFIAPLDNESVRRFIAAGLVVMGKTNTPEFGLSYTTEPKLFGPCLNPWDLQRSTGGSSGGSAAIVAARVLPVAHASDGGGSIRVPASCCGIFGLKPTRARVPSGPIAGEAWNGLSTPHVLSLSVRDSAAMLDCIHGPEIGDPYYAPTQSEAYLDILDKPCQPLNIVVCTEFLGMPAADADAQKAIAQTTKLLEHSGHKITYATPSVDMKPMAKALHIIAASQCAMFLTNYEKSSMTKVNENDLEPFTHAFLNFGQSLTALDYNEAVLTMHHNSRIFARFLEPYDMLLTPTSATLAPLIGELSGNEADIDKYNEKQACFSPFTAIANMTGQPAMSVPLYWTEHHIPLGSHFIAKFGREDLLFQLAKQLEEATPWFNKKPGNIKC